MNVRALLMFAIGVSAACHTEREAPRPAEPDRPAAVEVLPPEPDRPAIDRSLGHGFEMRRPIVDGQLTLVPIIATRPTPTTRYITLSEGMTSGVVSVSEAGHDLVVDKARIENRSDRDLFVLQGELVIEGKQDRVTAESVIVAPGSSQWLNVRCVEHDRARGALAFKSGRAIVEPSLRRTIAHEDQARVWGQVDAINRRLHLAPLTHTHRVAASLQHSVARKERLARIVDQLARREEREQIVGFAVAIDGRLVAIDQFATPELQRQLEPMLLASYLIEAEGPATAHLPLAPIDVRRFAASMSSTTAASTIVLRERSEDERAASRWVPADIE